MTDLETRADLPLPRAARSPGVVARFPDADTARRGLRRLRAEGVEPAGRLVVSRPGGNPRFQIERGQWGLVGLLAGALVGGLAVGLGVALGADFLAEGASSPPLAGAAVGAGLAGTLGLLAGLAFGEARGTRRTSEALRAHAADGEVAVRFDAPPADRAALEVRLRRAGATDVGPASHAAAPG